MASYWRLIFKSAGGIAVSHVIALMATGCQFSTDLAMNNNPPHWSSSQSVRQTVFFPDSTLCTLMVEDLNDSILSLSACFFKDSTDTICKNPSPWPWSPIWSEPALGIRSVCCGIDPCSLGVFWGAFLIRDDENEGMSIPFSYSVILSDPFDHFPISKEFWTPQPQSDSGFIGFDYLNNKVKFDFVESADSTPASTGVRTMFMVSGDLETSVQFKLRDDMRDGFEVAFQISTSPLAGHWDGQKTGFLITGLPTHVRFTCFSVNMQTDTRDVTRNFPEFAGYLSIKRQADSVSFLFVPGDPRLPVIPMNRFTFPGDSAVYVHVRMGVSDRLRTRHCLWSDFRVDRGMVRF
ncbi:MAG: hypothetical protein JW768_05045 [Chitinispirillaceae bacterium]|nr:hypothetical protein [Chitinispirillaceae bacterium]